MDESGKRKKENFRRVRTVVADLDDGLPTKSWPCTPTMVVTTSPGKQHVYFVLGDQMAPAQYLEVQKAPHSALDVR